MVTSTKGSCHSSYSLWRKGLSGLSFYLQSSESGYVKGQRKYGLLMHASIQLPYFLSSFLLLSLFTFSFSLHVFSSLFFPTSCLLPLFYYLWLPFYIVCHYRIYNFCPSIVFGFLWATLQDCPLTCRLSRHYLYAKCVGCTTLHFQTKLLVLFLTSLYFCFTSMDKN